MKLNKSPKLTSLRKFFVAELCVFCSLATKEEIVMEAGKRLPEGVA